MNAHADELVQEIAGMIFESVQEESASWKQAISRFQFFDGACKDTYSWVSASNEVIFYFPELDMEISEKVELLRDFSAVDEKKWVVCLIKIYSNRKIKIDFEYECSERWDPKKFEELIE